MSGIFSSFYGKSHHPVPPADVSPTAKQPRGSKAKEVETPPPYVPKESIQDTADEHFDTRVAKDWIQANQYACADSVKTMAKVTLWPVATVKGLAGSTLTGIAWLSAKTGFDFSTLNIYNYLGKGRAIASDLYGLGETPFCIKEFFRLRPELLEKLASMGELPKEDLLGKVFTDPEIIKNIAKKGVEGFRIANDFKRDSMYYTLCVQNAAMLQEGALTHRTNEVGLDLTEHLIDLSGKIASGAITVISSEQAMYVYGSLALTYGILHSFNLYQHASREVEGQPSLASRTSQFVKVNASAIGGGLKNLAGKAASVVGKLTSQPAPSEEPITFTSTGPDQSFHAGAEQKPDSSKKPRRISHVKRTSTKKKASAGSNVSSSKKKGVTTRAGAAKSQKKSG